MPIGPDNPFKGRQHPGDLIILCVRWYLQYPLSYQHVAELVAERGVEVDASCIWRWVQAYAPQLNETVHMIRKGRVRWLAKGDTVGQGLFIAWLCGLAA